MKLIYEYNDVVVKLLGNQETDFNLTYRMSSHCHMIDFDGKVLLYNNLTKKLFEIEKEEKELLINNTKATVLLEHYIKEWILVPQNCNEMQLATQLRDVLMLKAVQERRGHSFIIFTTTDCNARCYYCFEHGCNKVNMSEQTANDVADYIIKKSNNYPIYFKWFGGEPLYNQKAIDIITSRVKNENINFTSRITTNGYLFSEETIEKAIEDWCVKDVMITLDGTEEVYNKTKNYIYKDEISPFKKVVANIENLLRSGIKVAIRLNLSRENFNDLKKLIAFLKERFTDNKPTVFAIPLYDLKNERTQQESLEIYSEYLELEKMLVQSGFWRYNLKEFSTMRRGCMAENDFSETISPTGLLGKCEHFTEGERMFGSIYSDKLDIEAKNYFKGRKVIEKCHTCVLFPTCGGISNCPTEQEFCSDVSDMIRMHTLECSMISDYKKYKN